MRTLTSRIGALFSLFSVYFLCLNVTIKFAAVYFVKLFNIILIKYLLLAVLNKMESESSGSDKSCERN